MKLYDISFNKNLDEKLGVEGNKLSGGQRQIVWLIRTILNPAC